MDITTSPARSQEDKKFILISLLSHVFGNQLVIGDIHAPMDKISDIFKIVRDKDDIIGGWTIFHGFETPSVAFPIDPTGWDAIKGFLSMTNYDKFTIPFPVEHENDHGKRPWDSFPHFDLEYKFTDLAMRVTNKDIEVRDISDLPEIRAATEADIPVLKKFYAKIGDDFSGYFHPLQLKSDNYVVCVDNGEIVATAGTHFETPYTVQLGNIFVKEEYRGQEIGRAVTTACVLGSIKSKRVPTLFVNEENKTAIGLYEDIGFETFNRYEFWEATRN